MKRRLFIIVLILLAVLPVAAQSETIVYATAQRYEHGLMIWRADTGQIWALANDGRAFHFPVTTYTALPDNPIFGNPPSRLRPIHGMGKVWGNNATVRAALGWPTLQELGFDMPVRTVGGTTYLTQLDHSVIQISANNTWTRSVDHTAPAVLGFAAIRESGDSVTLDWNVQGTDSVLIEVYIPAESTYVTRLIQNLPVANRQTFTFSGSDANGIRFVLWGVNRGPVYNPAGMVARVVSETMTMLPLTQTTKWTTQAAFQQYENGFLIWRADTGAVMVFGGSSGGQFILFPQDTYALWPDPVYTSAPPNRIRPINAFGKVWNNATAVRQMIGQPTGTEQAYTLTVNAYGPDNRTMSYTIPTGSLAIVNHQQFWSAGG